MRYFFDIFDGHRLVRDEDGVDLAAVSLARLEAIQVAQEMIAEAVFRPGSLMRSAIRVRETANDSSVFAVTFSDVLGGLRS